MPWWGIVSIALAALLVFAAAVGYASFYFAVARKPHPPNLDAQQQGDNPDKQKERARIDHGKRWAEQTGYETVTQSRDGLRLTAYYFDRHSDKTCVLVHGYTSCGSNRFCDARLYWDRGYNVLVPDLRAHGASEGRYIGMGVPDRLDVAAWVEWVDRRVGPRNRVVLDGVSMGSATVLSAGALPLPSVRLIVADCGYTSVYDVFYHQLRKTRGTPAKLLLFLAGFWSRALAKYGFREASALEAVRTSDIPKLFIHGDQDDFVPYAMLDQLIDACRAPHEVLRVAGAAHAMSFVREQALCEAKVVECLDKYVEN